MVQANRRFLRCMASFEGSTNLVSPSVPLHEFAADAKGFWRERSNGQKTESELRPTSWLALLFVALAGGCSYGGVHRPDMELSSRVFGMAPASSPCVSKANWLTTCNHSLLRL